MKSNITPKDIGSLYIDPVDQTIYRCLDVQTELTATFQKVVDVEAKVVKPISQFNLIRLNPERPLKPRTDKGGTHKKKFLELPDGEGVR